jgi:hypothetical protein
MERPITRSLLATFIEYAATDRVTAVEWHRFVVQHYQDEHMENARRMCARILGGERKRPIPKAEFDLLHSLADALRASEKAAGASIDSGAADRPGGQAAIDHDDVDA